jgi:4-hydroxybenzoyl-CoA reductase subunit beta
MLRLPEFQYLAPRSLDEAATLLAEHGPRAMVVAGGTDLYPNMKRRQQEPATVVGLRSVPELGSIAMNGGVRIGPTVTLHALAIHPRVRDKLPALATAAGLVSTPHLRRMGTFGGNLCLDTRCTYYDQNYHWRKSFDFCMKKDGAICWVAPNSPRCWAVSSSDTAPVAVALHARLKLVSAQNGERTVDAGDFFRDDGIAYLTRAPDEILSAIEFDDYSGWRMTYEKLRRRGSFDFPILGVAAAVKLNDGLVEDVRLVLGAVGSSPTDQSKLAAPLIGTRPTREGIAAIAAEAYKGARPLDNTDLNYAWRKKMARVYVERALAKVCGV